MKTTMPGVLAVLGTLTLLTGCAREAAREGVASYSKAQRDGIAMRAPVPAAGDNAPASAALQAQVGADRGGPSAASAPVAWGRQEMVPPATSTPPPSSGGRIAPEHRKVVYNPDMYLSSTYMGGTGERDRIEKLINEGVLVDGKRVKLEAFPRNYAQSFPIPTSSALGVTAQTERSKMIVQGGRTYLQVGLQAIRGEAPRRPPLNIALVVDRSGSMQEENKLEFAKSAAAALVNRLSPDDTLSLVAFDDTANLLVPAQRVGNAGRIRQQIAAMIPGGGTNIFAGLQVAYREAAKHTRPDGVSRVLLLSDGQVTAGVNDMEAFRRLASTQVDRDIQTTTVGLGMDFNEDLMLAIAREGRGNYHFIKDGADTRQVFDKELNELTQTVARAVRLRVHLADGIGFVRALGAEKLDDAQAREARVEERKIDRKVYEELGIRTNRQKQPKEPGIKLLIPSFYRGDSHVVMLEVQVPPGRGTRKVADVYLKYKDLVGRVNRETSTGARIAYTPDQADAVASVNRSVKKNLLGFQTGEALTEAAQLLEQGRAADAVRKVDERMVVLGVAAREWSDADLDRDGRLLDRYKSVLTQVARNPGVANSQLGQYLRKSLTYAGYRMTR